MKYILPFILIVLTISACKRSAQSPIPVSHDYCHLLSGTQPHLTNEIKSVDSLIRDTRAGVYILEEGSDAITTRANLNTEYITILSEPAINSKMKEIMKEELESQNAWHVIHVSNPD